MVGLIVTYVWTSYLLSDKRDEEGEMKQRKSGQLSMLTGSQISRPDNSQYCARQSQSDISEAYRLLPYRFDCNDRRNCQNPRQHFR